VPAQDTRRSARIASLAGASVLGFCPAPGPRPVHTGPVSGEAGMVLLSTKDMFIKVHRVFAQH
jgi:hypothetical protein